VGPVTVAPTVHFLILNDDFAQITKPAVSKDVKAWAGVTLTWSKALTGASKAAE
jgi:hypothetical protein